MKVFFRKCEVGSEHGPEGWPLEARQGVDMVSPGPEWVETDLDGYQDHCRKMQPLYDYWKASKDVKGVLAAKKAEPKSPPKQEKVAPKVEKPAEPEKKAKKK